MSGYTPTYVTTELPCHAELVSASHAATVVFRKIKFIIFFIYKTIRAGVYVELKNHPEILKPVQEDHPC